MRHKMCVLCNQGFIREYLWCSHSRICDKCVDFAFEYQYNGLSPSEVYPGHKLIANYKVRAHIYPKDYRKLGLKIRFRIYKESFVMDISNLLSPSDFNEKGVLRYQKRNLFDRLSETVEQTDRQIQKYYTFISATVTPDFLKLI